MKTDDLIKALGTDAGTIEPTVAARLAWHLPLAIALSVAIFIATLGVRPDIGAVLATWRFDFKILLALALAVSALALALRQVRPAAQTSTAWLVVAAVPVLLGGAIVVEMLTMPGETLIPRLVGRNSRYCLTFIPLLSLAPLAALLAAMRSGAPDAPARSGAVAGLVAGGIGAAIYATHCTDDSPLFVATWYGIGIALITALGAALGSRLLRW